MAKSRDVRQAKAAAASGTLSPEAKKAGARAREFRLAWMIIIYADMSLRKGFHAYCGFVKSNQFTYLWYLIIL